MSGHSQSPKVPDYGDTVAPAADTVLFPVLLEEMPQPSLSVYRVYTVVAEKYQAIVSLGMANTRIKDYFDMWVLAQHATTDRTILAEAIAATFKRRGTLIPADAPLGLSPAFAWDGEKQKQSNGRRSSRRTDYWRRTCRK